MYDFIFSKIMDADIDSNYTYVKEILEAPKAAENLYNELYEKINISGVDNASNKEKCGLA